MQKILKSVRQVLFWLVLIVSLLLILVSFAPRCFGFTSCGVEDDSMAPLLRRGDLMLTKPVDFADIRVGDLLTFEDPDTHARFTRTVAEKWAQQQELVTKDAQSDTPDPYTIAYFCTVGRVVRTVRWAGYPSVWLHTMVGKIILVLLYIIWLAVEIEVYAAGKRREKTDA